MSTPDSELSNAIRSLQKEIEEKSFILKELLKNYDPKSINYYEYLKTAAWQEQRQKVFRRDGYKCVCCGEVKNLEAHHITYKQLGAESISDLVTLCDECHEGLHNGLSFDDMKEKRRLQKHPDEHEDTFTLEELKLLAYASEIDYGALGLRNRINTKIFHNSLARSAAEDILFHIERNRRLIVPIIEDMRNMYCQGENALFVAEDISNNIGPDEEENLRDYLELLRSLKRKYIFKREEELICIRALASVDEQEKRRIDMELLELNEEKAYLNEQEDSY